MQSNRGFTLIELMIAVSLLAVVAALAAPAMGDFIVRQRVASQAGDLALAMALARSEAIKSSTSIAVIPETVSPNGWANGWCVAPTTVANCDDAAVLRRFSSRSNVTITSAALAAPHRILFMRDGTRGVNSGRPRFKVSSPQLPAAGQNARCVLLTQQGRTEVSASTRDANCPQ
jgi:type IV fimbrial biogenesis protein FimT